MTTPAMFSGQGGVLVASPNSSLREQVRRSLHDRSCALQEVSGGADALVKLESGEWQLLFLDRRLPDLDVEELMEVIKVRFPGIEVVVLDSDSGSLPVSPWHSWLQSPSQAPVPSVSQEDTTEAAVAPLPGMIGNSPKMQQLYRAVRLVARRNTTVLILGATGTGKELVARAIHQLSPRCAGACVVVNCAAIPETLLESELFGYARGAFTGAVQSYAGRIHAAHGGTLFLDEVGELPLGLQAKLLRFLEQKEVQRLGSSDAVRVDTRVVAATNEDLVRRVEEGNFREDLYYRLAAFPVELPPLAERAGDVLLLAQHFLRSHTDCGGQTPLLSAEATRLLEAHPWSGNVRELQQAMERASILADGGGRILPQHLRLSTGLKPRVAAEGGPRRVPA